MKNYHFSYPEGFLRSQTVFWICSSWYDVTFCLSIECLLCQTYEIVSESLDVSYCRSSGPGGQNVNKG